MRLNINAEGYSDNTAGTALYNASQHHIRFSYGVMDINLSSFFPCFPHEAKALMGLVESYCSHEDKARLLEFLQKRARQMQDRLVRLETLNDHSDEFRREISELKRLYRRLMQNILLFEGMEVQA